MIDELGERMKAFEDAETGRRLDSSRPAVARLDGRSFHAFTRGLDRPYDERLSALMVDVAKELVRSSAARVGYTQSDEITLVWPHGTIAFDGRVFKMTSLLAAEATALFNAAGVLPESHRNKIAMFDCRAWNVPDLDAAMDCLVWRAKDAVRNSVNMLASCHFSHKALLNVGTDRKLSWLNEKGVDWYAQPDFFKFGTFVLRRTVTRRFSAEEMADLPPLHNARKNSDLEFTRHEIAVSYNVGEAEAELRRPPE